jgi:hypothetical protein
MSEQKSFGLFESGDGRFPSDRGKTLQELFQRFSSLQVVEKGLNRHSSPTKDRSPSENVRILNYHSHETILA